MIHFEYFDEYIFQMGRFNHQHSKKEMNLPTITHRIHVWYIYLHLP